MVVQTEHKNSCVRRHIPHGLKQIAVPETSVEPGYARSSPPLAVITPCSDGGGQCAGQGQKADCTGGLLCRELNANQGIAADVSKNKTSSLSRAVQWGQNAGITLIVGETHAD